MLTFVPIIFNNKTILVTNDYYKEDGVRIPVTLSKSVEIAKENNAMLVTKEIVDEIWKQADLKLSPQPMKPDGNMTSKEYYIRHNEMIEKQIDGRSYTLIAGHKKDIIKQQKPGKITIYGWHNLNGKPIQPVSSVHGDFYYDYSHGLRLWKDI